MVSILIGFILIITAISATITAVLRRKISETDDYNKKLIMDNRFLREQRQKERAECQRIDLERADLMHTEMQRIKSAMEKPAKRKPGRSPKNAK